MTHKFVAAALPFAILLNPFVSVLAAAERLGDSAQADSTRTAPYTQEYESHLTLRADHTSLEVVTQRFKILTQGAVASLGQQKLFFVAGAQLLDTVSAYTEKSDGRRIAVGSSGVLTQDASTGQQAIYFRDLRQRTVIFPDVAVGDTLVMTHKWETAPGAISRHFTEHRQFPRSAAYTSVKITVEAPLLMAVGVKAHGKGVAQTVAQTGGVERHTIVITPQPYAPEESGSVSALDRDPMVVISTYRSYDELGSAYGQAALPKAAVTPAIAALANDITRGLSDRRAQAAAIDAWMKKNIRYVAVFLSSGRVIPNDASTILRNKFGDCKDKTTLMSALLAAKGIASEPALINLGNAYTLPEPPTLAALNHVILYLPEFDLYDDPTANWAAFGILAPQAYDKPVVRVSTHAAKVAHTPPMRPDDHRAWAKTTITVAVDGTLTGRTEESATGALGMILRETASAAQTLGEEAAARRLLQKYLTPGTGHFELGNFAETADPVTIKSSFRLDERLKAPPSGARAVITHGILLVAWPGTILLGERLSGRESPFVCYAGRQTEDIEASFDPALPMPLPLAPVAVDNPSFTYRSNMTVEGRTLRSHREFASKVARQVCPPELEAQTARDLNIVRTNVFSGFAFASSPPSAPAGTTAAAAGAGSYTVRTVPLRPADAQANLGKSPPQPYAPAPAPAGSATVQACNSPIPGSPTRVMARVTGFVSADQAQTATRAVEAQLGAKISPAYVSWPRVVAEGYPDGSLKTMAAIPENMTVNVGDVVELNTRYRDPSLPCHFIPWLVNRRVDANAAASPGPPSVPIQNAAAAPTAARSPQTIETTRFVAAGQKLRLEFAYDIEADCTSRGQTTVRVLAQPAHGTVTIEKGQAFTSFPKENQRYECNTRKSDGTLIFYEPNSDYTGADSATLYIIYPSGSARTVRYSIEVK
jgi:transglutaminase-like putative cysteine protease